MVGRQRKILNLHWLKRPKTVPRTLNLDQKINDSKLRILNLSFNVHFSSRKSQSQQTLAKRIAHFTIQIGHFTKSTNSIL